MKSATPPSLLYRLVKTGGRNRTGRISSYHRGGGRARFYRLVELSPRSLGFILKIVRDPARKVPLFLVGYDNGYLCLHLATFGLRETDFVGSLPFFLARPGFSFSLNRFPVGSSIHSITPTGLVTSAGSYSSVVRQLPTATALRLPSGEIRLFPSTYTATYGALSERRARFQRFLKAGSARLIGRRPVVRGVAMNPVDHPHGGGQGKTSGGRPSSSPWGVYTKGYKTRPVRKPSSYILKKRSS